MAGEAGIPGKRSRQVGALLAGCPTGWLRRTVEPSEPVPRDHSHEFYSYEDLSCGFSTEADSATGNGRTVAWQM